MSKNTKIEANVIEELSDSEYKLGCALRASFQCRELRNIIRIKELIRWGAPTNFRLGSGISVKRQSLFDAVLYLLATGTGGKISKDVIDVLHRRSSSRRGWIHKCEINFYLELYRKLKSTSALQPPVGLNQEFIEHLKKNAQSGRFPLNNGGSLHVAAGLQDQALISELLDIGGTKSQEICSKENGASIFFQDEFGHCAAYTAAMLLDVECLKLLLPKSSTFNVDKMTNPYNTLFGETLLQCTICAANLDYFGQGIKRAYKMVQYLLSRGADPLKKNIIGYSAIEYDVNGIILSVNQSLQIQTISRFYEKTFDNMFNPFLLKDLFKGENSSDTIDQEVLDSDLFAGRYFRVF